MRGGIKDFHFQSLKIYFKKRNSPFCFISIGMMIYVINYFYIIFILIFVFSWKGFNIIYII